VIEKMDIHCEKFQPHIPLDRVIEIDVLVRELIECHLCHGLVWHPVTCETCEKIFCSTCIHIFHEDKSQQICPHGCSTFIKAKLSRAASHVLAGLKMSCQYESNGCIEVLLYNKLEEHEQICDYQWLPCDGCQQQIIKKKFDQHQSECRFISIKCEQCLTSYERGAKDLHTLTECLRIQFQQQKSKIEQLEKQIVDQQTKIDRMEEKLQTNDTSWQTFFAIIKEKK
jgi:hypothetical protein